MQNGRLFRKNQFIVAVQTRPTLFWMVNLEGGKLKEIGGLSRTSVITSLHNTRVQKLLLWSSTQPVDVSTVRSAWHPHSSRWNRVRYRQMYVRALVSLITTEWSSASVHIHSMAGRVFKHVSLRDDSMLAFISIQSLYASSGATSLPFAAKHSSIMA